MNITSRILPKIVNGIALFYATWMLLVLSAFFFARDFHEQRSAWVYGEEAPLMGSPILDVLVGIG
ncbi:MAG: hypothetical protein LAT50_12945 [Ectothiorhodospiraceae bacterium]|nr:hypothetical protein [Ectothiorhodospiraceae bacterium]